MTEVFLSEGKKMKIKNNVSRPSVDQERQPKIWTTEKWLNAEKISVVLAHEHAV